DVQQAFGRLGGDEYQAGGAVGDGVAVLEPVERVRDLPHVAGVPGLGHHVAVGPAGDRRLQVGYPEAGGDRIHAHPALATAEVQVGEPAGDDRPRGRLEVGRHRVLQVEDEAVGGERERL